MDAAPKRRGPGPVPPRRWTLRARLIALVVATAAVALTAVDIVLPLVVRDATIATKDATLQAANDRALQELNLTREVQNTLGDDSGLKGEIGWSTITVTGLTKVVVPRSSDEDANPDLSDGHGWGSAPPSDSPPRTIAATGRMGIAGVSIRRAAAGTWWPGSRWPTWTRPSSG